MKLRNLFSIFGILALSALAASAQDSTIKSAGIYQIAGAPTSGTSEVQTITFGGTPTGGTFTLASGTNGRTSAAIAWSATNSTLVANTQAGLDALNAPGSGNTVVAVGTMTSGIGTLTVTFQGKLAKLDVPQLVPVSSLTGTSPTLAVTTTTAGVTATFRTATPGTILCDTVTPGLYFNSSATLYSPTWTSK